MSSEGPDDAWAPPPAVSAAVDAPAAAVGRVPELLSLLDAEAAATRLAAGWALALVAIEAPDAFEPIAHRLADRAAGESASPEARLAFSYLAERRPEDVESVLDRLEAEAEDRAERRRYRRASRGFARSDYFAPPSFERDVGRTRLPSEASAGNPRRSYQGDGNVGSGASGDATTAGASSSGAAERDADAAQTDTADADAEPADEPDDAGESGPAEGGTEIGTGSSARRRSRRREALSAAAAAVDVESIAAASRFDELTVVAPPTAGRYADVYRTRAVRDGEEYAVTLQRFDPPEDGAEAFTTALAEAFENWRAVSDHEAVVTVYDWGREPAPWLATEYADRTLADRIDLGLEEAIWNARVIAEALAAAHERGVLHTGLDPACVVYADDVTDSRPRPQVRNLGLLGALRGHVAVGSALDPRYAAPEYFDDKFGQIDRATDVYHLGAVLYALLTGRPPFQGEYETVRQGVLSAQPTPPSAINPEIPGWLDGIVRKATAKGKLTRYETTIQLARELRRGAED
ncbi:MAG: serine/threonine-protein kinase [Haloarculaceae archaeon]